MSAAYQSIDGSEIWVQLNADKSLYLNLEVANSQVTNTSVEKITATATGSRHDIVDMNVDAILEVTLVGDTVTTRTGLLQNSTSYVSTLLSKIQTQGNSPVQWLVNDGGNTGLARRCPGQVSNMLSTNKALGTAYQNFTTSVLAYYGATTVGGTGGFIIGGLPGLAVGWASGAAGTVPSAVTTYNQYQEARDDWQLAALDMRSC